MRVMSFSAWKKKAADYAERELATGDLFNDSDLYSIMNDFDPRKAFDRGQAPSGYVREVFAEDFANRASDHELARGR